MKTELYNEYQKLIAETNQYRNKRLRSCQRREKAAFYGSYESGGTAGSFPV